MAFIAFCVYLIFVLVRPQEFVPSLSGVPVVKYSLIATAALLLFQKDKRFSGPQTYLLMGYLAIIFLSSAFNGWIGGGVIAVETTLTTAVLPFFVVANAINSRSKQTATLSLLVVAALIMVSNSMSQLASPDGIGWAGVAVLEGNRSAYVGIFNDPNDMSMFLVMTLPVAVFLYGNSRKLVRVFYALASAAIMYGVYLANSRGGLLGLAVLVVTWFVVRYGTTRSTAIGLTLLPVAVFAISQFRAIDPSEASAYGRIDAWYQGIQMLINNPVFGVSQGAFLDHHYLTAHNSFVLVFAELGMSGYFFWLAFLFFCTLGGLLLWNERFRWYDNLNIDQFDQSLGKCLTFSMLGFVVTGFFLSRAYSPLLYIYCGILTAAFYQAVPVADAKQFFNLRTYWKPFFAAYFGSIVAAFVAMKILI